MKRLIPLLLLSDNALIKTRSFKRYKYIGDPVNTIRVFSEKGADEALIVDKKAYKNGINLSLLSEIAANSFMPLTYAGGIQTVEQSLQIIACGFERVAIGIYSKRELEMVKSISHYLGKSGVCAILNLKQYLGKKLFLYDYKAGRVRLRYSIDNLIQDLNEGIAGEIIIVDVQRDGTRTGFSLSHLLPHFNHNIPIMACGGISSHQEVESLWTEGFSSVAASALLTLRPPIDSVLISYPDFKERCKTSNLTQPKVTIDRYASLS